MAKGKFELSHPQEYNTWHCMKQRLKDPAKAKYYAHVSIAPSWSLSFVAFLSDMGEAPSPVHTLDRVDNSLGYCKANCRWATPKEQANNRTNNVIYGIHYNTAEKKWIVRKTILGVRLIVGRFNSYEEAKKLYT